MFPALRGLRSPFVTKYPLSSSTSRICLQVIILNNRRPFSPSVRAFRYRRPQPHHDGNEPPRKPHEVIDLSRWWSLGLLLPVGCLAFYIANLEETPVTKRRRFMFMSKKKEQKLAKNAYEAFLKAYRGKILPQNHPITLLVRDITSRLLAASNLGRLKDSDEIIEGEFSFGEPSERIDEQIYGGTSPKEWKLLVVNSGEINAVALFDTIIVHLGMLPVAGDEDSLAAAIAHEIAHIVARHSAEVTSSKVVSTALNIFLSGVIYEVLGFVTNFGGTITKIILDLPNSRTQEKEADFIGLLIASRACFDPTGSINLHSRLGQIEKAIRGKSFQAGFLRTHPPSDRRIELLKRNIPLGEALAAENGCEGLRQFRGQFDTTRRKLSSKGGRLDVTVNNGRSFLTLPENVEDLLEEKEENPVWNQV